ncbi:sulfurtransferase [Lysobacter humi (ex Lee et al. 2017)]
MTDYWTTLVDATTLAAHMDAQRVGTRPLAIVDARVVLAERSAAEGAYRAAHLPSARFADLETDLSGPHRPGAGRHPWPAADDFGRTLGRLGIAPDTQVVVYDDASGALAAARLWYLLRAWGHRCVAVLDGGLTAWRGAGLPLTDVVPPSGTSPYPGAFDAERLIDTDALATKPAAGVLVVDARAAERYRGDVEPLDRKAGHIPGAVNRPFADNLIDGRFKSPEALRREYTALLGGQPPSTVVASCGSGVTACHLLLAMVHAGLDGARLYTGSWSGWIEDDARPIERA